MAWVRASLKTAYGREPSAEEFEGNRAPFLRTGAEAALLAWATVASEVEEPDLAAIEAPCLILWGSKDRIVKNQGKRLARDLKDGRYIVFPGGGHVLMETEAEKLDREVLAFLAGH